MSDFEFAVRLVVFQYLIPMQRQSRARVLCCATNAVVVAHESHIMGTMEHLLHVSDALLVSRGYSTSFLHPFSRLHIRKFGRYNVDVLMLAECDEVTIKGRRADPRSGYRIFSRE